MMYRQTYNISRTLEGNKIVDHSSVVEASTVDAGVSLVGAAPIASSY